MNPLDKLPADKRGHMIGGSLVAAVAASIAIKAGYAMWAWQIGQAAALLVGLAKEGADAYANRKATGSWMGVPRGTPHGVEGFDALATTLGGTWVCAPLFIALAR